MNTPSLPLALRPGRRALLAAALGLLFLAAQSLQAQYLYNLNVQGTAYHKNASGNIVPVRITNQSLLQDAAQYVGLTNANNLTLVYHIHGSDYGDTIDAVDRTSGVTYTTVFGLYFGEDPTLNRMAITNSTDTEVRRIDYIYTHQNSHSMGSGFVTKRFIPDRNGNVLTTVAAKMQWIISPDNLTDTRICTATFTTTSPWKPLPALATSRTTSRTR